MFRLQKTPFAACASGRGKNESSSQIVINWLFGFFPLVLFLILMGHLAESLDSRKNLLSIWEGPSLAENLYESNYYKSVLEKEKNMITCCES